MDREKARALIASISAINPHTQYSAHDGKIYVNAVGGLTPEQRELIRSERDLLYWYLITPPEVTGICIRGHAIEWKLSSYGCWLCSCYFLPYASQTKEETSTQPAAASRKPSIKSHWLEDAS